jgi:hypothetical protein
MNDIMRAFFMRMIGPGNKPGGVRLSSRKPAILFLRDNITQRKTITTFLFGGIWYRQYHIL